MLRFFLLALLVSLFVGCGSDSDSSDSKSNDPVPIITSITGEDPDAVFEFTRTTISYTVSGSDYKDNVVFKDVSEVSHHLGKAFFVDDLFMGIMDTATEKEPGSTTVTFREATQLTHVYTDINLDYSLEKIAQTMTRSLQNRSIGKYDHLNKDKLKASFYVKNTSKNRSIVNNELVMRIDIPKDYNMSITPRHNRSIDCDIFDQSCVAEISAKPDAKISLEDSFTSYGLTFSTEGSYIEFGLGTNLKFTYNYVFFGAQSITLELVQSMFYEANFVYKVNGELSQDWSTALELTDGFDLIIPHPYTAAAKVAVNIKPDIEIGASGTVKGEFIAKANNKRDGAATFTYDSSTRDFTASKNITTSAENVASTSMEFSIEADANAYISPLISLSPRIDFLNISQPFSIGDIRSSVKINNAFEGKFETGFLVTQNSAEAAANLDASASFMITYEPIVDYKFDLKIGLTSFYADDDYTVLYQGSKGIILDWNIALLNTPTIKTQESGGDTYLSFDIDANSNKDKIKFYYNLKGKDITTDNVFSQTLWNGSPIKLDSKDSNKVVVKAVLLNSDISTGVWSFGSSYSLNATQTVSVIEVEEPEEPTSSNTLMYWSDANSYCTSQGKRLPSREEFFDLYDAGISLPHAEYWTYESWWNTDPYEGYQSAVYQPGQVENMVVVRYHDRHKVGVYCIY